MPPIDTPLDVLSAVSFPDTVPAEHPTVSRDGPSGMLYGGIMLYPEGDAAPEGKSLRNESISKPQTKMKNTGPKKKRTKRAGTGPDAPEEEPDKKRGRPRVNPTDETPSERRRTQIRLAQRAYRLRKESVISSLHERVSGLEKTVEDMSKTFLAFNDEAIGSGALSSHPRLAQQLRDTTERFIALARGASSDSANDDVKDTAESNQGFSPQESQLPTGDEPQSGQTSSLVPSRIDGFGGSIGVAPHNSIPQTWNSDDPASPNSDWRFWESLFNSGVNMLGGQIPRPPTAPPSPDPRAEYTYSFQESTFSRRLHRRSLELAYTMMIDPFADPSVINSKFILSLRHAPRDRLANAFLFVLQRKAGEPLEYWNKPYFYIGGAGTHYPRKDEYGNTIYPPNMHPPEKALASQLGTAPTTRQEVDNKLEAVGFGGNWFDCHDVEGYMSSKGIHLNGSSTYVQLTAPSTRLFGVSSPPSSSRSDILEPERSPPTTLSTSVDPQERTHIPFDDASLSTNLLQLPQYFDQDKTRTFTGGSNNLDLSASEFTEVEQFGNATHVQESTTGSGGAGFSSNRPPFIDVDRFINELIKNGICLGRAPGFRQADVDAALTSSICAL